MLMSKQPLTRLALMLGIAASSACTNLSGLGGSTSLSCPLDAGGTCQSIRATYEQVSAGQTGAAYSVPAQTQNTNTSEQAKSALFSWNAAPQGATRLTPTSGQPIRSESDVLRVWIAPYEDDEGVLRDQAYTYVVLDNARWVIEHNQRRIMQAFAPVKAPSNTANKSTETDATQTNQSIVPVPTNANQP